MSLSAFRNTSLAVTLVGALNWGVLAIRQVLGDTDTEQIPDLLEYVLPSDAQLAVYFAVFLSSLTFLGTYAYEFCASRMEITMEDDARNAA